MTYISKTPAVTLANWICGKCGVGNYTHETACVKCQTVRK